VSRASAIYGGWVRHRRFAPHPHAFSYRVFLMYLDLDELPELFRGRWFWSAERPAPARFRRADHLGDPAVPLKQAVAEKVREATGRVPAGPIRLLTHLAYFGYCFNPVSIYYCFDAAGERVETIVAEVDNTPWGERHVYVLDPARDEGRDGRHRYRFPKAFHVSPFLPMEIDYDWRLVDPGRFLALHMDCNAGGRKVFDATLTLKRREITGGSLAATLAWHPFMTGKVLAAIYWQALRLWLKGTPFFTHPDKRAGEGRP
jgi:hypothetical protein